MLCPRCQSALDQGDIRCDRCGLKVDAMAGYGGLTVHTGPSAASSGPLANTAAGSPMALAGWGQATMVLLGAVALGQGLVLGLRFTHDTVTVNRLYLGTALVLLAAAVTFMAWFYRLRHNAGLWGRQRRSQGWAIWGWIVPGPFLWFPLQIAQDSLRATTTPATRRGRNALLAAWWASWVLAWISSVELHTVTGIGANGVTIQKTQFSFLLGSTVVSNALTVVAAVLALWVVRMLSGLQHVRMAQSGLEPTHA